MEVIGVNMNKLKVQFLWQTFVNVNLHNLLDNVMLGLKKQKGAHVYIKLFFDHIF